MKRLALLLALAAPSAPAEARTLPPRDECGADADFARFRAQLLDIAARHDAAGLLALTADDIEFSFGGGAGKSDFAREWGLADPGASGLWPVLAGVLVSGCAREGEEYSAPYIFRRFPEALDAFTAAVAGPGARLHQARSAGSESSPIPWEIAEEVVMDEAGGWARVRLSDGRAGFVPGGALLSPIDYRAVFERRDGAWRLVAFIAGD